MASLEELAPARNDETVVYAPYYQGTKRKFLPYAVSLYHQGGVAGERPIEGDSSIPFEASWSVSQLPTERTRCRVRFARDPDLSYETTLSNAELIDCLIELIEGYRTKAVADFPQTFYQRLFDVAPAEVYKNPQESVKLGTVLVEQNWLSQQQLDWALQKQRGTGERLGEILTRQGLISPQSLSQVLSEQKQLNNL